jgi:hypothetical protein
LRETTDVGPSTVAYLPIMTVAADPVPAAHAGNTLWDEEVQRLLAPAADLRPAARAAIHSVLVALAADDTADAATKADAVMLLAIARTSDANAEHRPHRLHRPHRPHRRRVHGAAAHAH